MSQLVMYITGDNSDVRIVTSNQNNSERKRRML